MSDVLIIGTGLIGCSLGLALSGASGWDVTLDDVDADQLATAVSRGAGRPWDGTEVASVVVAAAAPGLCSAILLEAQRLGVGVTYTHVASVQSRVQRDIELSGGDLSRVVGGHPLAGSERSGAQAASAELFAGRPWVLCRSPYTDDDAVDAVRRVAEACGGVTVEMSPEEHDAAVARVSHLPQVVASALAATLLTGRGAAPLAGPGILDTTRIAASDPALWVDVLTGNAAQVAPVLRQLVGDLTDMLSALDSLGADRGSSGDSGAQDVVRGLLERGRAGRALLPVKRGTRDEGFATVSVVVPDEPGRLAALLQAAAAAGINVEDVRVEHVPGRPRGVIALLVSAEEAEPLAGGLRRAGWRVDTVG